MLKALLRYLFGTVSIRVSGSGCERFLNAVNRDRIFIWDVFRDSPCSITMSLYRRKFKKLHNAVKKSHVKIHIVKKKGLPHHTRNYRKRMGLLIGALIVSSIIYAFSMFIWEIKVDGCESVSAQEVLTVLSAQGFEAGKLKSGFNIKEIENDFLKSNDKVTWISINIKGTTAYVEIRENVKKPEILDTHEPCSIYASRDGVIASVSAYMGYSMIQVGDTVTAGDLIVSGNYTDKYGVEYKLHSYAKVMAYTTHSKEIFVPFKSTEHIRTGGAKNKYSLKLIRFSIPLYFNKKIMYNNYDITKSEKSLRLTNSFVLPITFVKTTYTEIDNMEFTKSRETALEDACEQLRDFEYNLVGMRVLDRQYEEQENDEGVSVKVMLECYEDIGIVRKIG